MYINLFIILFLLQKQNVKFKTQHYTKQRIYKFQFLIIPNYLTINIKNTIFYLFYFII